jgi:hypothetical protein
MADSPPYTIHSDGKITLSPLAIEMARQQGLSLTDMAKHLLQQDRMRRAGLAQRDGES